MRPQLFLDHKGGFATKVLYGERLLNGMYIRLDMPSFMIEIEKLVFRIALGIRERGGDHEFVGAAAWRCNVATHFPHG